jgi:hypothetical protein
VPGGANARYGLGERQSRVCDRLALPGVLATLSPWLTPVSESGRGAIVVRVGLSSWMYAVRVLVSDPMVLVTVSRTE